MARTASPGQVGVPAEPEREWYAREWLEILGIKQVQIVAKTTFNKGQVSDYVKGRRRWNRDVLGQFADAMGLHWADLLRKPGAHDAEIARLLAKMSERDLERAANILKTITKA